MLKVSLHYN